MATPHPPRVFTFWTGPKPPIIDLCLRSIVRNIPDVEVWTLEQWKAVYDGRLGPWRNIERRRPNVQSDALRYWLLATYGGIWIDADYIAFRDVRDVWDASADLVVYPTDDPTYGEIYTAMMASRLGSPIMEEQCRMARRRLANPKRIGGMIGPPLTVRAIAACPCANAVMVARHVVHPMKWRGDGGGDERGVVFRPETLGLMIVHGVVARYRRATKGQLFDDKTLVGRALRKAFGVEC